MNAASATDLLSSSRGTRIQSVGRASRLLLWVAGQPNGAAVGEIAQAQDLSVPTTYHIVNTLVDEGLLSKDISRRYVLGDAVAVLAQSYLRSNGVSERLRTILTQIAERTHETVYVADWGAEDIRVLGSIEGSHMVRVGDMGTSSGRYENAHARANGKVLLAYASTEVRGRYLKTHKLNKLTANTIGSLTELERELAAIRRRGYAYDNEEFLPGVSCVAAPALREGAIVASFAVLVPTERFKRTRASLRATVLDVIAENA